MVRKFVKHLNVQDFLIPNSEALITRQRRVCTGLMTGSEVLMVSWNTDKKSLIQYENQVNQR